MAGSKKDGLAAVGAKEPLFGFMPRNVGAAQVQKAMVRSSSSCGQVLWPYSFILDCTGWRCQPLHEATFHRRVQEDPGYAKEAARVRTDGGILLRGESYVPNPI